MSLASLIAISGPKKVSIFRSHPPSNGPRKWICPHQSMTINSYKILKPCIDDGPPNSTPGRPIGDKAKQVPEVTHTTNNFELMNSRKRISQNSFPNFIYIIPKSFMVFCQELCNPKKNYENQI